jgi:hypothetical protein
MSTAKVKTAKMFKLNKYAVIQNIKTLNNQQFQELIEHVYK